MQIHIYVTYKKDEIDIVYNIVDKKIYIICKK